MIIDGETYACEACVRGHRVKNCQHLDRPLQPISKKGRPVSQCQHCRVMRKSRSAHVKCDCGKRTNNVEGGKASCSCNSGGRCSCAFKREQPEVDLLPESTSDESYNSSNQPKTGPVHNMNTNRAFPDGPLASNENGHHNLMRQHADTAQKCWDYNPNKLNYENSIHNISSLGNGSVSDFSSTDICESQSGSLEAYESLQEQDCGMLETTTHELWQSNLSTAFQQFSTQLPLHGGPNIEHPENVSFQLFGDPSDAARGMFGAELDTSNIDCDLGGLSSHYQAQDFSDLKPGYSAHPTHATIFPSIWAGMPNTGDFSGPAEVLRHNASTLLDPMLHCLNANATFSESECPNVSQAQLTTKASSTDGFDQGV